VFGVSTLLVSPHELPELNARVSFLVLDRKGNASLVAASWLAELESSAAGSVIS
jgi:hypothetical protein